MAKLNGLFEKFLSKIEPDSKAKEYAQEAHTRVVELLGEDEEFRNHLIDTFLYGSYKRQTAIGDIKDVDIIVLTNFDPSLNPDRALQILKASLNRCYKDSDNLEYQTRSIKVSDPLPGTKLALTLDVIPAIPTDGDDDPILVPDREMKAWIKSHPKGHLANTSRLNAAHYSKEMYVPLVKIMKAWWKYQAHVKQPHNQKPKPKGFWLECLASENFNPFHKKWADHFIAMLESICNSYPEGSDVPQLKDPGLPGEKVRTGMTKEEFTLFLKTARESLALAKSALREEDEHTSSKIWQTIFGPDFPLATKQDDYTLVPRESVSLITLQDYSHKEELSDRGIKVIINPFTINIRAELYLGDAHSKEANRIYRGEVESDFELPPYHWIKYTAEGPDPYRHNIYWQVVNTGAHALKAGGLRGKIFPGGLDRWEQSLYTGKHWIECFAVDNNNMCVGRSGPFYVTFRNPEFPYFLLN